MAVDAISDKPVYTLDSSESLDFTAILDRLTPDVPNGRPLTPGETALARSVFGDSIDYSKVRIHHGAYLPLLSETTQTVLNGNIYFPGNTYHDDFSTVASPKELGGFMHEMTHIWQEQHGLNLGVEALTGFVKTLGDYDRLYPYQLEPGKKFENYGFEQQADIVEDYFTTANGYYEPENASLDDYRATLPFDEQGGERVVLFANYGPADDLEWTVDLGPQPGVIGNPAGPETPSAPRSPAPPAAPDAGPNDPGTSTPPDAVAGGQRDAAVTPPQPRSPAEPAVRPQTPTVEPPEQVAPPLPQEPAADPDEENGEEEETTQGGNNNQGGAGGTGNDVDGEQGTGGAGGEMPNPMDDGPSYINDFSVLVNRNAPYVNPGSGEIDMPVVNVDPSVLLNRNAPYTNPGPGGGYEILVGDADVSVLLNRNAPYVNPGTGDIDLPAGNIDISVLLNRNGPRMTFDPASAEPLASTRGDNFLSDTDLALLADGLDSFKIG